MKLLTKRLRADLLRNGRVRKWLAEDGRAAADFFPVVKLFTPDAGCTWLLTELDPDDPDLAFGLCDLGMGHPELGYVRLSELEGTRGPRGLPVERDRHFKAFHPLSNYAAAARHAGAITENLRDLANAGAMLAREGES